jgi:hypothetical protein
MNMKAKYSWEYAVMGFALICLVVPAPASGQVPPTPQSGQAVTEKEYRQEVLDQLVAPIALYPDSVLTQILIASTYPLEVVQADRWVKQNKSLKGDAMTAALEKQPWDNSVKALAPFPDVLTMMSEKLDWTQKLGDAFLAQQKDVMDTVQKLRRKASEAGNLKHTKEQELKMDGDNITIQPTSPQVVYVPTYDPTVVYGTWPYPAYPPYPVYAYPPGAALFAFSIGVAVGAAWHGGGCHPDWHGGSINININNSVNINRPGTQPSGGGARGEQWKHNPEHRQGVPYKDTASREKYSPTNRAAVDNRQNSRGYDRPSIGATDRSGPEAKSQDNAFGGMDRGGQAERDSARGSQSVSSARSLGGASGGGSRGGGGRGGRR